MSSTLKRTLGGLAVVPLVALGVLAGAGAAHAGQPVDGDHKVGYCHATHSAKNPYVYIVTDKLAVVRAHEKHQLDEDIIPAFDYLDKDGVVASFPGQGDPRDLDETCGAGGPPV